MTVFVLGDKGNSKKVYGRSDYALSLYRDEQRNDWNILYFSETAAVRAGDSASHSLY